MIFMLTSCVSTKMFKQQNDYERELGLILKLNENPEMKVDELAMVLNDVLQESMNYRSSKHSLRHINQFSDRNQQTLGLILDDLEEDIGKFTLIEKLNFVATILKKPYIKSFREVVPKVEKKIDRKLRQLRIFGRFLSILSPDVF